MTTDEIEQWADEFAAFHGRFAHLFSRSESREQSFKYLRGLLSPAERKNSWQMAEIVGEARPDGMQRLLYRSPWDAESARDILQGFIRDEFGDPEGIFVVDETGFLKKGTASVGVKRQYSGTAGKIENCQIGTFLGYATRYGQVFLDRRLFLPEDWCQDPDRRAKANVPEEVRFQTKPQQAEAMLIHAWAHGVPMRFVTGDALYGDATHLRDTIRQHHRQYVLAVCSTTRVWTKRPAVDLPRKNTGGRPQRKARLSKQAPPSSTVCDVVARWPAARWQRLVVAEGEKGPRTDDWAACRVIESRDGLPGPSAFLLARRSISDPSEITYYLSNAPQPTPLLTLAQVASTRYTIEQTIEEAKGETGLDHYEVRTYPSWYRHITLSIMAQAFLAHIRAKAAKKKKTQNPS